MRIRVLASTKYGYSMPKEEAIEFSSKSAGICYLPDSVEDLFNEPPIKTQKRAENTIASGHHSVFGHPTYNLMLEQIPKILAIILNNEKKYDTSEKSARYTRMETSSREKELYDKWIEIYKKEISREYPQLSKNKVLRLAQENARYLISVFTPATTMEYTVSFEQLNYIISWAINYMDTLRHDPFSRQLRPVLEDFVSSMPNLNVTKLNANKKNRSFSIFAKRSDRYEEFGENYCTTYIGTFAQLALAQRHRTLSYEMTMFDKNNYYVPPIIHETDLEAEWIRDISSLGEFYPQGTLVLINERGTIENFILKCTERLCGCAQLEIMEQTRITLNKYLKAVSNRPELYKYLEPYSHGARCTFPNWVCDSPCVFGPKNALNRYI